MNEELNTNEDLMIDAMSDHGDKLSEIDKNGELAIEAISETNDELRELNDSVDMLLTKDNSTHISVNINGGDAVAIEGPQGEKGDKPVKGKDYFTQAEINEIVNRVQSKIKIPKDGVDGKTPVKGEDYLTQDEIEALINDVARLVPRGKDGKDAQIDYAKIVEEVISLIPIPKDGLNGKDGSPDTAKEIVKKINSSSEKIDAKNIDGIPNLDNIKAHLNRISAKTYNLSEIQGITISAVEPSNPQLLDLWFDIS